MVRACEDRIDLLRAAIVGPAGTPYHNGLFFFDIQFPSDYPHSPPVSIVFFISIEFLYYTKKVRHTIPVPTYNLFFGVVILILSFAAKLTLVVELLALGGIVPISYITFKTISSHFGPSKLEVLFSP